MFANLNLPLLNVLFITDGQEEQAVDTTDAPKPRKKRVLSCAACKAPITQDAARIEKRGGHEHSFFNPYGIVFLIGCFAEAPGCVDAGESSNEFSWFPGYLWRVAVCRSCQAHLGWRFFGDDAGAFHGLILDRLVEQEQDEDED